MHDPISLILSMLSKKVIKKQIMVSPVDINTVTGLSEQDAIARLKDEGYNELPSAQSRNLFSIAWEIVQDPIFLLLVGGGVIYWILGDLQVIDR